MASLASTLGDRGSQQNYRRHPLGNMDPNKSRYDRMRDRQRQGNGSPRHIEQLRKGGVVFAPALGIGGFPGQQYPGGPGGPPPGSGMAHIPPGQVPNAPGFQNPGGSFPGQPPTAQFPPGGGQAPAGPPPVTSPSPITSPMPRVRGAVQPPSPGASASPAGVSGGSQAMRAPTGGQSQYRMGQGGGGGGKTRWTYGLPT